MQLSAEKIWNLAQEQLRFKLSKDTFNMWFAPLRACAMDGNHVMLEAPNEFSEVWLKDNYTSLLQDAFAIAAGRHERRPLAGEIEVFLSVGGEDRSDLPEFRRLKGVNLAFALDDEADGDGLDTAG